MIEHPIHQTRYRTHPCCVALAEMSIRLRQRLETPQPADPIPAEYLLHALSVAMPDDAALVEEAPSHRPLMHKFMPMRGQDSFYTMASGGLGFGLPAAVGIALGRPGIRNSRAFCMPRRSSSRMPCASTIWWW